MVKSFSGDGMTSARLPQLRRSLPCGDSLRQTKNAALLYAVRHQISNVFGKLQVAGRAEAIICARDAGMGS
jgi:hypothetical protein